MFSKTLVKLFLLHFLNVWLSEVDCVSQWDPFCNEETLYTPYVRIFQKGRSGAMLRDRGPGFIDVNGLEDIYVCTNGLVMLYYAKTKGNNDVLNGEVFEHGELHWAPHHCELYNPSCTSLGIDQPKKTLLSILLIGHPQDYRRPALQMFVAPAYDVVYQNYVNLTSLIMIGTAGECLLEKGVERARLRVRIVDPTLPFPPGTPPVIPPAGGPPPPEESEWFCQLDSQRKLGQTNHINLMLDPKMVPIPKQEFLLSPFVNKTRKIETGSLIQNRFKAAVLDKAKTTAVFSGDGEKVVQLAEQVYAVLLNDRKMRFIGCLEYPDFNIEQADIINSTTITVTDLAATAIDADPEFDPVSSTSPFWTDTVPVAWPEKTKGTPEPDAKRLDSYLGGKVDSEDYAAALKKVDDKKDALKTAKDPAASKTPAEIATIEAELVQEEMIFSLWPYKQSFVELREYTKALQAPLKDMWTELRDTKLKDPAAKRDDLVLGPQDAAEYRHEVLVNISGGRYERRFDPYNPQLVEEYNQYLNYSNILQQKLRKESEKVGPDISNAETLYSRFKLYKSLTKKALTDLENAIKKIEKTKQPVSVENVGDPFGSYFVDTKIEISDALKEDGTGYSDHPGAKACYPLPAPVGTCKAIKPDSTRACQLCKNRKKLGVDWISGSEWKQEVFDLIESIHKRVCPYISDEFAISINSIMKGYLSASPVGTGLRTPINGSRMYKADHHYQRNLYNATYWTLGAAVDENSTVVTPPPPPLPKEPFWDQIIVSLQDCYARAKPLDYYYNEDANRPTYITFRKAFPSNKSEAYYDVEDLFMQEKADYEFSFNWAIDMNWRIFSTVLGYCMPHYEDKIPLISAQFYALYSKHFLHPLRQIWMSNRDNPVLKTILGSFYGTGKGERWSKICMESSFIQSEDRSFRPPRYLYVNAFTEMNYFTTGPMSGTGGRLLEAVI